MAVFATYVVVTRGFEPVTFAPGDEVPEWAEGQVGAHCLEPESESEAETEVEPVRNPEPEPDEDPEPEDEEPTPEPDAAPDFTAPTPARRNSRSRK